MIFAVIDLCYLFFLLKSKLCRTLDSVKLGKVGAAFEEITERKIFLIATLGKSLRLESLRLIFGYARNVDFLHCG